jgi:Fe-S-cluster containining protein
MSGCAGACCAAFPLSTDVDDLAGPRQFTDAPEILLMLVPLTPAEARARLLAVDSEMPVKPDVPYFTCRHWDRATRRCGIYEHRPHMCRIYPTGSCDHGCPHVEVDEPCLPD